MRYWLKPKGLRAPDIAVILNKVMTMKVRCSYGRCILRLILRSSNISPPLQPFSLSLALSYKKVKAGITQAPTFAYPLAFLPFLQHQVY